MPKKEKDDIDADEHAAGKEFLAEKRDVTSRKPKDRATAARLAQDASSVAKAYLEQVDPEGARPGKAVAAILGSESITDAPPPPAMVELTKCRCGCELGTQVRGVCQDGQWYCPTCFMGVRNMGAHAAARAVACPTCNVKSVDFTGMNMCPICHSRAARPYTKAA